MADELKPAFTIERNAAEVKVTNPPNQPVVYSNFALVSVTAEEIFINFAVRNDGTQATGVVKVYTSLPAAKRLLSALGAAIQGSEELFGEIELDPVSKLSPEVLAKLGSPQLDNGN